MKHIELALGRLLLVGIIISFFFIIWGGALYLIEYGRSTVSYHTFLPSPTSVSVWNVLQTLNSSPHSLIQLGLIILVFTQVLRVAVTAWFFLQLKDYIFTAVSVFILGVLIYSLYYYR